MDMRAPVALITPTGISPPTSAECIKDYLDRCYAKLPFALKSVTAHQRLADRDMTFADTLLREFSIEAASAKRRVR